MSFNIGLSALNAAQQDINVTGNNIANASTTGFKGAKTVFGDVYAASVLGGGGKQTGSGVSLMAINQSFNQGNISFTDNTLDLAINGEGFFILGSDSGVSYTRSGAFGTDKEGFVVNAMGQRLQGFAPSDTGQATGGGPLADLRVTTGEIQPRPTTLVETVINLDAAAQPSSIVGTRLFTNSGASGTIQVLDSADSVRDNAYEEVAINVTTADRLTQTVTVPANATANQVAQQFAGIGGVAAVGRTVGYVNSMVPGASAPDMRVIINGRALDVDTDNFPQSLVDAIGNNINNVSARIYDDGSPDGIVEITHTTGGNIVITPDTLLSDGTISLLPSSRDAVSGVYAPVVGGAAVADHSDANTDNDILVLGGTVEFTLDEGVSFSAPDDSLAITGSIFGDLTAPESLAGRSFETNQFDPRNPDTYYRSTAINVYDSVGTPHSLQMFFVKERAIEAGDNNLWSVYFQIDGRNIGYDPNSPDGDPILARYDLRFDDTGRYDQNQPPIEITNWFPVDAGGRRIGSGPVPGNPNVAELLTNSNFRIDLSRMTAFGGDFSVQANNQDGYSKGQLTGLEVNQAGLISARFSNGQSQILGEVALANFANPRGLANLGGTTFAETSESGAPSVSGAGTAGLGAIQSGALEDSNVDLPTELVQLIISQRNYQAAAQIISATDDTTQTIINL